MLSIIIPVFNEEESLLELKQQIISACEKNLVEFETIFIDDGSRDTSWQKICDIARNDQRFTGIRFRRNFGKAAALTAGIKASKGAQILMMDADLQDDPEEIPDFLKKLDEGYDVINGWKKKRLDPWHKVYPSRVFNAMIGYFTGLNLHDHNCGLKMFRQEVGREIRIYGELHRFIPVLAHARGFRVTELVVNHRPRVYGQSKYGFKRFLRGFLDLLTVTFLVGYSNRPQHLLGGIGLTGFALGVLGLIYLSFVWLLMHAFHIVKIEPIGTRPLLMYSMGSMLIGFQAFSLGLLAELIISRLDQEQNSYSVRDTTDNQTD